MSNRNAEVVDLLQAIGDLMELRGGTMPSVSELIVRPRDSSIS